MFGGCIAVVCRKVLYQTPKMVSVSTHYFGFHNFIFCYNVHLYIWEFVLQILNNLLSLTQKWGQVIWGCCKLQGVSKSFTVPLCVKHTE